MRLGVGSVFRLIYSLLLYLFSVLHGIHGHSAYIVDIIYLFTMVLRVPFQIQIHAFLNPAIAYCTRNVRIEGIVLDQKTL